MAKLSRRKFILTAGATTAGTMILHGCSSGGDKQATTQASPTATTSPTTATGDGPEVTTAKLGFVALTDSAPLVIAKEKGFFDKYGMTGVEVLKQASWPVTRDNLELGSEGGGIDGAHILSPMPYMMTLGTITKTKQPVPMYILARLNLNGQGISVSNTHKDLKIGTDSAGLKQAFTKAKSSGKELKCAVTFPGGTHDLWLRYWLAAGGIDPNKDVSVIPVPPPQMVANMKVGNMESFCVGEPWNAQLVNQKAGYSALVTGELWKDHPEKAFTMRKDWVDKNPKAAKALLMAVLEAQQWCDKPENKAEMCKIVSQDKWFKVPVEDILPRAQGNINFGNGKEVENFPQAMKFWSDNASYPYKSHDLWFLIEDMRWGYIPADTDTKALIDQVNREDLWKEAATALKVPAAEIPISTSRGVETFFDGVEFDPENPTAYLKSLKIKKA
ncbi:CmpA/NrtA family ABC transporter substrate-binding protein [Aphanothece sacrum]|uniref:ABC-type nitrate/sulfonate/bicarbonate transport system, periplasmic component n=1 Tax=Aphanothece sacrum FPU1 TaxID=1920663 RepID=A0A401IJA1_APHSA|nr:CmpA/NrtA family ABC transporter substrate-binding protein [Aphanothece sacrum]GBF81382.1 ABC-type nitrate/sulfonate/bicarbonate transport system, periplasmic component [Aphanothece sacrum FPU1]GBF85427.1 ABC transporter periplasmic protein [Aphanothece sacrum FPU3]